MKYLKLFTVLAMSAITLGAFAVDAQAYIKVKSTGEGYFDQIQIFQQPSVSLTEDQLNTQNDYQVNLYATVDGNNYSEVRLADLNGLKFYFKANKYETSYKMLFSNVSGKEMKLQRTGVDGLIPMTEAYTFTCTTSEVVEFTVVMEETPTAYTRNVTANQWGTICYPKSITEVQGGTLYSLTYTDGAKVYAEEVVLPTTAGQAYIFQANADATQLVMPYTGDEASVQTTHGLVGTFEDITVPAGAYGILNNYVVEIAEGNPLLANRAYIKMEDLISDNAPKRGRAIFMIQNATTGLEGATVNGLQNGTYMVNGQLVIVKDGKTFNVLGL